MTNYFSFKLSTDVEKNPGPTQSNTDSHETIIKHASLNVGYQGKSGPSKIHEVILVIITVTILIIVLMILLLLLLTVLY